MPAREMRAAREAARACDLMLALGSSLGVAPAAELPFEARTHGAQVMVINREPTPADGVAASVIRGDVAVVLPEIVSRLTSEE